MTPCSSPRSLPFLHVAPALLAAAVILTGCGGSEEAPPPANQAPSVALTGGPPEGGEASYLAEISWSGTDPDGTIELYEYAVDPPHDFTLAEIADPEGSGLRRTSSPGPEDGTEILTYAKDIDGGTVSFDFVQTRLGGRTFLFSTPDPDSAAAGASVEPLARFTGMHTVYVRSRDDDGATSFPERLSYTAVTATPSSRLTKPILNGEILYLGTEAEFCWDGVDVDAPAGGGPTAYVYKLVNLAALTPAPGPFVDIDFILFRHPQVVAEPWIEQDAENPCTNFALQAPGQYLFAVRAVDVAGAVEPFVDPLRGGGPGNAVVFQTRADGVFPLLNVNEELLGDVDGNLVGVRGRQTTGFDVYTGIPLHFTWTADARSYGGRIDAFRYLIGDHDSGWTTLAGTDRAILPPAGVETVTIQVRDTDGNITGLDVHLRMIETVFDRDLLLVDDARDTVYPRDNERDQFWRALAINSGRLTADNLLPENLTYATFGTNDVEHLIPIQPDPGFLARYRRLFWDVHGVGYDGVTGLLRATGFSRRLAMYLRAGGQLWVSGNFSISAMLPTDGGMGDFSESWNIPPGSFPWEFLHLYSTRIHSTGAEYPEKDGLLGVTPWPGTDFGFGAMDLDTDKQRAALAGRYGVIGSDVVIDPILAGADPEFRGRIDNLYSYDAFGSSTFDGRLVGVRYTDLGPAPTHGRTVWFGFPLYFMEDGQAGDTFNRVLDWFREEQPAP